MIRRSRLELMKMRQITYFPIVALILPLGNCWRSLPCSSFTGPRLVQQRSFARQSPIRMMPEGPEVRTLVDQLQAGVDRRLVDIQFLSGRYVRHGRPLGFADFAKTITPTSTDTSQDLDGNTGPAIDIIKDWNAKGKFIYITLDTTVENSAKDGDANDFLRSIWVTLGMTGQFVSETVHESDPRYARWYLEMMDVESGATYKIYYHDQRNFGTMKFSLSRDELVKKLAKLGPDILDPTTTVEDFLQVASAQRPTMNICKFLMDQSVCREMVHNANDASVHECCGWI
jgi:formamidopyrimidine-DNA glycosylase